MAACAGVKPSKSGLCVYIDQSIKPSVQASLFWSMGTNDTRERRDTTYERERERVCVCMVGTVCRLGTRLCQRSEGQSSHFTSFGLCCTRCTSEPVSEGKRVALVQHVPRNIRSLFAMYSAFWYSLTMVLMLRIHSRFISGVSQRMVNFSCVSLRASSKPFLTSVLAHAHLVPARKCTRSLA